MHCTTVLNQLNFKTTIRLMFTIYKIKQEVWQLIYKFKTKLFGSHSDIQIERMLVKTICLLIFKKINQITILVQIAKLKDKLTTNTTISRVNKINSYHQFKNLLCLYKMVIFKTNNFWI